MGNNITNSTIPKIVIQNDINNDMNDNNNNNNSNNNNNNNNNNITYGQELMPSLSTPGGDGNNEMSTEMFSTLQKSLSEPGYSFTANNMDSEAMMKKYRKQVNRARKRLQKYASLNLNNKPSSNELKETRESLGNVLFAISRNYDFKYLSTKPTPKKKTRMNKLSQQQQKQQHLKMVLEQSSSTTSSDSGEGNGNRDVKMLKRRNEENELDDNVSTSDNIAEEKKFNINNNNNNNNNEDGNSDDSMEEEYSGSSLPNNDSMKLPGASSLLINDTEKKVLSDQS